MQVPGTTAPANRGGRPKRAVSASHATRAVEPSYESELDMEDSDADDDYAVAASSSASSDDSEFDDDMGKCATPTQMRRKTHGGSAPEIDDEMGTCATSTLKRPRDGSAPAGMRGRGRGRGVLRDRFGYHYQELEI